MHRGTRPRATPSRCRIMLLRDLGVRRGDAVRLGPQHIRHDLLPKSPHGYLSIVQGKTGMLVQKPAMQFVHEKAPFRVLEEAADLYSRAPCLNSHAAAGRGRKFATRAGFGNVLQKALRRASGISSLGGAGLFPE